MEGSFSHIWSQFFIIIWLDKVLMNDICLLFTKVFPLQIFAPYDMQVTGYVILMVKLQ